MSKQHLKWAAGAFLLACAFMVASGIVERDWLELGSGLVFGTGAVVALKAWPNPSLRAVWTMNLLGLALLALAAASLWQTLR